MTAVPPPQLPSLRAQQALVAQYIRELATRDPRPIAVPERA